MLKKILWVVGAAVILFAGYVVFTIATTKKHSPAATTTYESPGGTFVVEYCRPYKKGREIFGELLPYDTYWRTGANEPTLITIPQKIIFGNKEVKPGKYRLYTIPNEKEWVVVLNSEIEEWGYYEPDYRLDVARINIPVTKISTSVEQFLISLNSSEIGVDLTLNWDFTQVVVSMKF